MLNSPNSALEKFLLDENIPISVKRFLESRGLSVKYEEKGVKNSELASIANKKACVLVGRNSDFLKTWVFPPKAEKLVNASSLLFDEVKEFKGRLFVVRQEGFEVVDS